MDSKNNKEKDEITVDEISYIQKVRSLNLQKDVIMATVEERQKRRDNEAGFRLCVALYVCAEADKNKEVKEIMDKKLNKNGKDEAVEYAKNLIEKGIINKLGKNESKKITNDKNITKEGGFINKLNTKIKQNNNREIS